MKTWKYLRIICQQTATNRNMAWSNIMVYMLLHFFQSLLGYSMECKYTAYFGKKGGATHCNTLNMYACDLGIIVYEIECHVEVKSNNICFIIFSHNFLYPTKGNKMWKGHHMKLCHWKCKDLMWLVALE